MSFRIIGISAAVGLAAMALSGCVDNYGYYDTGYYGGYYGGPALYDYYGPGPYYGGYYYWSGGHRYYHRGGRGHGYRGSYSHGYHGHGGYHGGYHGGGYHGGGGGGHMTVAPANGGSGTISNTSGFR